MAVKLKTEMSYCREPDIISRPSAMYKQFCLLHVHVCCDLSVAYLCQSFLYVFQFETGSSVRIRSEKKEEEEEEEEEESFSKNGPCSFN